MSDTRLSPWRHLPNAISLLRMALVLPVAWAILVQQPRVALGLIAIAGVSDGLDGFVARRYGWQSRLGGILDALADKLLLVACFLLLAWVGLTPWWLALLVCGRDVVIVAGALAWRLLIGPIRPEPTLLSKACTLMQIVYLLDVLVAASAWPALPRRPLEIATALLCIASGIHYVLRWSLKAWAIKHPSSEGVPR